MSDFMHGFWPVFITAISLGGIFGCVLLLWFASKVKVTVADDGSNGHVWDGDLREMNNPMPMWWVGLFIITVIFGLAYLFLFPGLGRSPTAHREAETAKAHRG